MPQDNPSLLEFAGLSQPLIQLVLVSMAGKKPVNTLPDDTSFKPLVEGYQNIARMRLAPWLTKTGALDDATALVMRAFSGPNWRDKPWYNLYWDLYKAHQNSSVEPLPPPGAVFSLIPDAIKKSWVPWALGGGVLYLWMKRKK